MIDQRFDDLNDFRKSQEARRIEVKFMPTQSEYIDLTKVSKDYLKEQGMALRDFLSDMDEDSQGILKTLEIRIP
mgnify:CR=1 FL=1